AATGDIAAGGAGLSERIREADGALRPVAWSGRRAGLDDEILGADDVRRHRDRRAAASGPLAVPAFAGTLGCHRDAAGCDATASRVAEAGGLRPAHLCRRCLCDYEPRFMRPAGFRVYRPSPCAAGVAGRAGVDRAELAASADTIADLVGRP